MVQRGVVFFSHPFKATSLYDNPQSFPDLKILITTNELLIGQEKNFLQIRAHRCLVASSSDHLKEMILKGENELELKCSNDFEAMHCEKALKSIYMSITIERDEFASMYDMYRKLGMKCHLEQFGKLWTLQCENCVATAYQTVNRFGDKLPESLDPCIVSVVLQSLGTLIDNGEVNVVIRPVWIFKFMENQSLTNVESCLSLINSSIKGGYSTRQDTEELLRKVCSSFQTKDSPQNVISIINHLSVSETVMPCFSSLSSSFKLEMIKIVTNRTRLY